MKSNQGWELSNDISQSTWKLHRHSIFAIQQIVFKFDTDTVTWKGNMALG